MARAAPDRTGGPGDENMRCSISLFPQNYGDWDRFEAAERGEAVARDPALPDARIFRDELRIGRQVEELGFDGIWTVEHHFTPYTMVTHPLQFLTYFAGCTEKVDLGTMVIVLPWHNPVRVTEDIIMLDHMIGDRRLVLGLGRGAGRREFGGLNVPMAESRGRFVEALEIIRRGLRGGRFTFAGDHFNIREIELRPCCKDPEKLIADMHMAWGSTSSIPIGAENGLRPMIVPQKTWDEYRPDIAQYNRLRREAGNGEARPIVCLWMYCAETEQQAEEGARRYMTEYGDSATRHYELFGSHFADIPTYEQYARFAKLASSPQELSANRGDLRFNTHIWGTPDQCVRKIAKVSADTGAAEIILVPKYATMTFEVADRSMRLFAKEALPGVKGLEPGPLVSESLAVYAG